MLELNSLSEVRGNNVIIYSLKTLLEKNKFPKFSIMSGPMGVGKSSVAMLVAKELNESEHPVQVYNFGKKVDMQEVEDIVFKMNPVKPHVFIFEELHGLDKGEQTALLTMLDKQPQNVYIICTTTEVYHILRTIRSRAQIFEFKLLGSRQLAQLLDDYLKEQRVSLTPQARQTLLSSCYGVPRDLLKNADLAISGEFSNTQLNELLGQVSEDLIFSLICSLKSTGVDFSSNAQLFMDEENRRKLVQLRDFFTRYLLERNGLEGATLSKERIKTLDSLFTHEECNKVGRTLIRATPETLMLELSLLNMELTSTGNKQMVGQQVDRLVSRQSAASAESITAEVSTRRAAAKVTTSSLSAMKLTD